MTGYEVAEACWLSKLDHNYVFFYQISMDQDSIAKTAFCSPRGMFAFTCISFGLKNAQATLQRYINVALREQLSFCSTYIDDVIVYSFKFEQNLKHIDAVLSTLKAAGLTASQRSGYGEKDSWSTWVMKWAWGKWECQRLE